MDKVFFVRLESPVLVRASWRCAVGVGQHFDASVHPGGCTLGNFGSREWISQTMSETETYPELYLRGIQLFNEEEFFECHDVLEELWTDIVGHERRYYQGLIQVAVSLFHFGNSNFGGARKLYRASREKLEPYGPKFMGVDLTKFLSEYEYCFQEIIEAKEYPKDAVLHDDRIPKIDLN